MHLKKKKKKVLVEQGGLNVERHRVVDLNGCRWSQITGQMPPTGLFPPSKVYIYTHI